jgi:hypothetical protein
MQGTRESLPYRSCSCGALYCALAPSGRQTDSLLPSNEVCSPLLVLPQSEGASSGPPTSWCVSGPLMVSSACRRSAHAVACNIFAQHLFGFSGNQKGATSCYVARDVPRLGALTVGISASCYSPPASILPPLQADAAIAMLAHESFRGFSATFWSSGGYRIVAIPTSQM